MNVKISPWLWLFCIIFVLLGGATPLYAGDLEPSAPPGSTMKTLDQVEPRTPITTLPFIITKSGSYYLTKNIYVADSWGIRVHGVDDVTIDLMGFAITGNKSSRPEAVWDHGIWVAGNNIEIRHGTIRNFGAYGIWIDAGSNHRVIDIRSIENGEYGIQINSGLVKNCFAKGNGKTGIIVSGDSVVSGNISVNNTGWGYGLYGNGIATGNIASSNQNVGFYMQLGSYYVDGNSAIGNIGGGFSTCQSCTFGLNHAP